MPMKPERIRDKKRAVLCRKERPLVFFDEAKTLFELPAQGLRVFVSRPRPTRTPDWSAFVCAHCNRVHTEAEGCCIGGVTVCKKCLAVL